MSISIKDVASAAGGSVALSISLGLSRGAVSQWDVVPPDHVLNVSRLCDYKFTPHQLRPDLYPHADDGLPDDLRKCRKVAA